MAVPRDLVAQLVPVPADARFPATLSVTANQPPDQPLIYALQSLEGAPVR